MESLMISLNAVVPMFLMMALGYALKGIHFFSDNVLKEINKLAFKVLIPLQLFKSTYQANLREAADSKFLLLLTGLLLLSFGLLLLLSYRCTPDPAKRGSLFQGMFRGNTALMGMTVIIAIYGEDKSVLMAVGVAIAVPIYNGLSVVVLELCRGGKMNVRQIIRGILTNPLIIGCACGLICNLVGLRLPTMIASPINSLAGTATPIALVVLGASFHLEKVSTDRWYIIIGVATKLLLSPAVAVLVAVAFGLRGVALGTLAIIFASPASVSSFAMAQQMDADADLAAALVVFTGMFSCFTMFLWTFSLLQLGLI